ncbi:MAG TPA: YkgJ family cysteine cluster protein [Roseiflexaceae bacterium]|nr:YkgJ family cysteine cluster protein [Roseiflexaceae bacterium]
MPHSRSETIALALEQSSSPAGRARVRAHIAACGAPILAAKEIFLAAAEDAEQTDPRYPVACRAGCWFCCTTPVAVSVFEAAMVRSAVLALPEEAQAAIWARLQAHIAAQHDACAASETPRTVFHHRCPLLTDAGLCSIYEARPLACRSLLSSDADRCRRSFLEGDHGDPQEPFAMVNTAAVFGITELMITLNEGYLDHYPNYELASALYALWTDPQSFMAWQQGELFARNGFPRMAESDQVFPTPPDMSLGPPE